MAALLQAGKSGRTSEPGGGARRCVDQPTEILGRPIRHVGDRRLEIRHHDTNGRGSFDRGGAGNCERRVDRQDWGVAIVEHTVVVDGLVCTMVRGQMPVNQQMLVSVLLGLVDVLRRGDRDRPDYQREENADPPVTRHGPILCHGRRRHN
jgi:hypothetical protein